MRGNEPGCRSELVNGGMEGSWSASFPLEPAENEHVGAHGTVVPLCVGTHTLASIIVMGSLCLGHGCVCVQHPVRAALGARLLGQLPAGGLER